MLIFNKCTNERIEVGNQIKEEGLAYSQEEEQKPLVTELWATRNLSNKIRVKNLAKRSGLPLIWVDKVPGSNNKKGMEKLNAERGVLLLRDRSSSFIERFQHPIGRCAKFYKLTAYNNCNLVILWLWITLPALQNKSFRFCRNVPQGHDCFFSPKAIALTRFSSSITVNNRLFHLV
ncbi:MAG: hypothetical protein B6I30_03625 [Desulfobacteraceae bacterium 4572_187]|nr:MAG: hypothetical protein B6I30_03625 [Desulfobacteraceae bacterium 4572_187]